MNFKLLREPKYLKKMFTLILNPEPELTEIQALAVNIANTAIDNKDANLLIAPDTGIRYIQYRDIFIRLEVGSMITIINGKYTYEIFLPHEAFNSISSHFNLKLQAIRDTWELSIKEKTTRSLTSILSDISK